MFGFLPGPGFCCAQSAACYRSHFCGLCNVLREEYGLWSRWLINRDSVLLPLLGGALAEKPLSTTSSTCCNPLGAPRPLHQDDLIVRYAAAVTICGLHAKLEDDSQDEKGMRQFAAASATRFVDGSVTRALGLLHAIRFPVAEVCSALRAKPASRELREACAGTSYAYGEILAHCGILSHASLASIAALRDAGQELGFLIHAKDAWDDYDSDLRARRFNPLLSIGSKADAWIALSSFITDAGDRLRDCVSTLHFRRNADLLRTVLINGVQTRLNEWRASVADDSQTKSGKERKRGVEKRNRWCDNCDCCIDIDCSCCCRGARGGRSGGCNKSPGDKGGDACDCNPCDGDCCGCDCC